MLPRLWIVLLAVLLLAAPAGSAFEETADAQPSIGLCDDAVLTHAEAPLPERTPDRAACTVTRNGAPPPDPLRDPIFRPPRPPAARA
jgi:hypothetical protein